MKDFQKNGLLSQKKKDAPSDAKEWENKENKIELLEE